MLIPKGILKFSAKVICEKNRAYGLPGVKTYYKAIEIKRVR